MIFRGPDTRASAPPTPEMDAARPETRTLGTAGRAWRTVLVLALAVLFVTGSVVGQDSWWPLSPWRMFSTSTPPTGAVVAMALEVQTAEQPTWTQTGLTPKSVGLNRAEVEGRVPQIVGDPSRLGTLAESHARLRPDAPRWTAVRLVRRETVIVDRKPTGEIRSIELATWRAP